MSGSLRDLRRRLTRVEQTLLEFAAQPNPSSTEPCNCPTTTIAHPDKPEEFEAEMNRMCPLHAVRRLGIICTLRYIRRADDDKSAKLEQLLKTYRARRSGNPRLSRLREVGLELKRSF